MATFLERYLEGDCTAVWDELQQAGEAIRVSPLYEDGWAVALETMSRVRHNLDILIPRLIQRGYLFGDGFLGVLADVDRRRLQALAPVLATSGHNTRERLDALETAIGPLPLSVRAFYIVIGGVNLVGRLPAWDSLRPQGIERPVQFARDHPQFDWRHYSLDHGLDPLFVWSLDAQVEMLTGIIAMMGEGAGGLTPYQFNIAPDYQSKYGIGGDGPYFVETPCLAADAFVRGEWHSTTFVDYLRICLNWAGMPGLERADHPPRSDISELTQGFVNF